MPRALMVRESRVGADVIEAMPALRGIVRYGIGVDNIDLAARGAGTASRWPTCPTTAPRKSATRPWRCCWPWCAASPARDASGARRCAGTSARQEPMYRIAGKTLGLLGYGRIARAFERKMRGFGVERVLVYDPLRGAAAGRGGAGRSSTRCAGRRTT